MEKMSEFIFMSQDYTEKTKIHESRTDYYADSKDTLEKWVRENSLTQDKDNSYLLDDGKNKCNVLFSREDASHEEEKRYRNKVVIKMPSSFKDFPGDLGGKLRENGYYLTNYPLSDEEG